MTLEEFQALDEEQKQYMMNLVLHGTPDDEGFLMKQLPLMDTLKRTFNPWAEPRMADEWNIAPGKEGRLGGPEMLMGPGLPMGSSLKRDAEHWRRPATPNPAFMDPGSFEDLRQKEWFMEHPADPGWNWDQGRTPGDIDKNELGDPTLQWEREASLSPVLQLLQALRPR